MANKKAAEIERKIKDIRELLDEYDFHWQKLCEFTIKSGAHYNSLIDEGKKEQMRGKKHAIRTTTLEMMDLKHFQEKKQSIEDELDDKLRKLHRFTHSIKDWQKGNELRDKDILGQVSRSIEVRFKKNNAYYCEGISSDDSNIDLGQQWSQHDLWMCKYLVRIRDQRDSFNEELTRIKDEKSKAMQRRSQLLESSITTHEVHLHHLACVRDHIRSMESDPEEFPVLDEADIEELQDKLQEYLEENPDLVVHCGLEIYEAFQGLVIFDEDLDDNNLLSAAASPHLKTQKHMMNDNDEFYSSSNGGDSELDNLKAILDNQDSTSSSLPMLPNSSGNNMMLSSNGMLLDNGSGNNKKPVPNTVWNSGGIAARLAAAAAAAAAAEQQQQQMNQHQYSTDHIPSITEAFGNSVTPTLMMQNNNNESCSEEGGDEDEDLDDVRGSGSGVVLVGGRGSGGCVDCMDVVDDEERGMDNNNNSGKTMYSKYLPREMLDKLVPPKMSPPSSNIVKQKITPEMITPQPKIHPGLAYLKSAIASKKKIFIPQALVPLVERYKSMLTRSTTKQQEELLSSSGSQQQQQQQRQQQQQTSTSGVVGGKTLAAPGSKSNVIQNKKTGLPPGLESPACPPGMMVMAVDDDDQQQLDDETQLLPPPQPQAVSNQRLMAPVILPEPVASSTTSSSNNKIEIQNIVPSPSQQQMMMVGQQQAQAQQQAQQAQQQQQQQQGQTGQQQQQQQQGRRVLPNAAIFGQNGLMQTSFYVGTRASSIMSEFCSEEEWGKSIFGNSCLSWSLHPRQSCLDGEDAHWRFRATVIQGWRPNISINKNNNTDDIMDRLLPLNTGEEVEILARCEVSGWAFGVVSSLQVGRAVQYGGNGIPPPPGIDAPIHCGWFPLAVLSHPPFCPSRLYKMRKNRRRNQRQQKNSITEKA